MIVAAVAAAASFLPAWRATFLSPMVAIRNEPESVWRTAQRQVRHALRALPPLTLRQSRRSARSSASSQRRFAARPRFQRPCTGIGNGAGTDGAASIDLLEKTGDQYGGARCSIPAPGILLNRLMRYSPPLALNGDDFRRGGVGPRTQGPEHVEEIAALAGIGARIAVPLRTAHDIVGVVLLGAPTGGKATRPRTRRSCNSADVFALMIENGRLNARALEQEKLRRDLALAAEVQRRLLPAAPPRSGVAR